LLATGPVQAQIVTDGSVGPKVSLSGGEIKIGADLGSRRGDNLFHSFEKFGIATSQSATFTGPGDIKNVISRVTGGEVSNIDGTLASRVGQADLYFLNPAGVMFGPNAQLDVPGSFHVSTAHELRFDNGVSFSALDKSGSGLTVAPPEAFGFLDMPPGRIAVEHSQLSLQPGKVFSLVGGDIDIGGRGVGGQPTQSITSAEGTVNLASITAAGQFRPSNGAVAAASQGIIRVTDQARIDVSGNGGGTIRIRGGSLEVQNSLMFADNYGDRDSTTGLDLQAGSIEISNSRLTADVLGSGQGGITSVKAGQLTIRSHGDETVIGNRTFGPGDAGMVSVQADRLLISGDGARDYTDFTGIRSESGLGSSGEGLGPEGNAGRVEVTAGALEIRKNGAISTATHSIGGAGTVSVRADRLLISRDGGQFFTGIGSQSWPTATGDGGRVEVTAGDLQVLNGGQISTNTFSIGNAGTVSVRAGRLPISGNDTGKLNFTDIASNANPGSTGAAGKMQVTTNGAIELHNGGVISSNTFTSGNAGTVEVRADRVLVAGNGTTDFTGIASSTEAGSTGAGGAVNIQARSMVLREQGAVTTRSSGTGPGGSLSITATDTLRLDSAAIEARTASAGGGDVTLTVGRLLDLRNSTLTTSVAGGTGSGGNITITPYLMVLDNSRIEANAKQGAGGNITVRAGQLIRTPDSLIRATGRVAGNITITAPNTDVAGSLVVLPETFFDVSGQLRETCAARGGRPVSSFNAGGRGGLPPDPGAPLAASSFGQPLEQQTATRPPTSSTARPPQAVKPITVAGIPQPVLGSPRLTCRG
jgi:filamentous hemagglutinin family protein